MKARGYKLLIIWRMIVSASEYVSWIEVDLDAIRHNFRHLQKMAAPAQIIAVVKSEAYGHGLEPIALTLAEEGAWGFGVVSVDEVERLRAAGITQPIIIIAPTPGFNAARAIEAKACPAVYDYEFAQDLSREAVRLGREVEVHIKVDTGMGRLSIDSEHAVELALKVAKLPNVKITGIYSHLANADGFDQSYTKIQLQRFTDCIAGLEQAGFHLPWHHLTASAGLMAFNKLDFNLTRAGISLYGLWPSRDLRLLFTMNHAATASGMRADDGDDEEAVTSYAISDLLHPALSFKTRVMQVKSLPQGSSVSYGCTFTCHRDTRVAVLPIGYADGYDRHLSNCGEVLVRSRRAPIMGRVCMNLCMVDVTDIPDVAVDDEVVLLGRQGDDEVSADEMANRIGTINYEVVTRLPMHLPRVYVGRKPSGLQ